MNFILIIFVIVAIGVWQNSERDKLAARIASERRLQKSYEKLQRALLDPDGEAKREQRNARRRELYREKTLAAWKSEQESS